MGGDISFKKGFNWLIGDATGNVVITSDDEIFSSSVNTFEFSRGAIAIELQSTLTPTDIQYLIEFSPNQGGLWFPMLNDFMGTMIYDDTSCVTLLHELYDFYIPGSSLRLRVVPNGCTAVNFFSTRVGLFVYNT